MRPGEFSPKVRQAIFDREDGCCAACGTHILASVFGGSVQHRRSRNMGGSRDPQTGAVENGLILCGSATTGCHGYTEGHPTWALHNGYRVPQGCDPSLVPVRVKGIGWVLLNPDGTYQPCEDPDREATRLLELVEQEFTELRKEPS